MFFFSVSSSFTLAFVEQKVSLSFHFDYSFFAWCPLFLRVYIFILLFLSVFTFLFALSLFSRIFFILFPHPCVCFCFENLHQGKTDLNLLMAGRHVSGWDQTTLLNLSSLCLGQFRKRFFISGSFFMLNLVLGVLSG